MYAGVVLTALYAVITPLGNLHKTGDVTSTDEIRSPALQSQPGFCQGPVQSMTIRASLSADDAEEATRTLCVDSTSNDLDLGDDTVGLRFQDVAIPAQDTILSAHIGFTVAEADSGSSSLVVRGEAADSAAPFAVEPNDISGRPTTAAAVSWPDIPPWITVGEKRQTPDLALIIEEITDRSGWVSGNPMAFVVTGAGSRTARSVDGLPESAPLLLVEHCTGWLEPCDADYDTSGSVDGSDLALQVPFWDARADVGGSGYDPKFDPTADGVVRVDDLVWVARRIGLVCSASALTNMPAEMPTPTATLAPTNTSTSAALNFASVASAQGTEYFVSPDGSDANPGTLASPWQTLAYAFGQLSAGDVLYLRGGTYYVSDLKVNLQGTAAAPITIQSYPGEQAVIDGGVPDFRTAPNSEWELVDGGIQLYRSTQTFTGSFVHAWLPVDDIQLVEYEVADNLESTNYGPLNGMDPFYMGPGVQLRADGHIYIRLEYNPNDLTDSAGNPIDPTPLDVNPNNNPITISTTQDLLQLDPASYVHFKDLDFSHARNIMDVKASSHHIELSGCRLNYGRYGLLIRENVHDWEIHNCEFTNGLPAYVYWTDVKNRGSEVTEAYPEFQSAAISGAMPGFNIHDNLFRNTFDALKLEDGTSDAYVRYNTFRQTRDDAINLMRGVSNVDVAHNMLWHVGGGISNLGSGATPGHVYIHHNVIDNSAFQRGGRPGNYRENHWPVWTVLDPFGSHGGGNEASWWKLYNNTIVTRKGGYGSSPAGPEAVMGNSEKYVYNNIFYIYDDRILFKDDTVALGSHYNGNVMYRSAPGTVELFNTFGICRDWDSLASFQSAVPDWEGNALEVDPGFDMSAIEDPTFDPATIWDRYRPGNPQVLTEGASYLGLGWPGTENVDYRGAVP